MARTQQPRLWQNSEATKLAAHMKVASGSTRMSDTSSGTMMADTKRMLYTATAMCSDSLNRFGRLLHEALPRVSQQAGEQHECCLTQDNGRNRSGQAGHGCREQSIFTQLCAYRTCHEIHAPSSSTTASKICTQQNTKARGNERVHVSLALGSQEEGTPPQSLRPKFEI